MPGARCTRRLVCEGRSSKHTSSTRRQDHTILPYATAPFVCAPSDRSQALSARPAIKPCAGTAASTASHPNVRDDGQRPSSGRDGESYSLVFISDKQKYFCKRD